MSDNYPVDGELRRQAARIEALEQAHAELAETVDQMISKAGTDCDKCEGRGWRINVPSQTMYPCTWCSGKGKVNIAAPAPDPVCAEFRCVNGYLLEQTRESGVVTAEWVGTTPCPKCNVPTAEPAPLDPGALKLAIKALEREKGECEDSLKRSQMAEDQTWLHRYGAKLNEITSALDSIRAYGRDGAR